MAVAIDPKTGKPLNVPMPGMLVNANQGFTPMPSAQPQQKDFLGRPMKPFTNTQLTGNDATALDRTPMPDYMQTMQSDAVKANGGNPLPSGSDTVNSWANLPSWGGGQTNAPQVNMPQQQQGFSIDKSSLQAEAAARIAKLRAGVEGAVTAGKASRKNLYDYTNTNTQGNRALQDFDNSQRGDIYGGSAREDKFRLQRSRGIDDTFTNNAYTNDINALDNQLTSFDTLAPEQQQTLYNDLLRQERDYGLQEGALTGYLNGQKTASQANSDRSFNQSQQQIDYQQSPTNPNNIGQTLSNQLNEMKIGNYSTEIKQQAQLFEQELKSGKMSNEAAEYNLQQLKDPNSPVNQSQKLDLQMKQLEAKNLPETERLKLQQLKKTIAQIGVVHYKPQTANEIEMDKVKLQTAQKQLEQLNNPQADPAREAQGTIAGDLAEATSEADVNSYFSSNASHFIPIIGADAWYKMKKDALAPFTAGNKDSSAIRTKAIADAQKDVRWLDKKTDHTKLIAEYESYYK